MADLMLAALRARLDGEHGLASTVDPGHLAPGELQLGPVVRSIEAIRTRYDGTRLFGRAIPALVAIEVEDQRFDPEAGDKDLLDAQLTLKVGAR